MENQITSKMNYQTTGPIRSLPPEPPPPIVIPPPAPPVG